jgi:plastocyanin
VIAGGPLAARSETATLKGKFVLDGKPPAEVKVNPNQDAAVCGKHNLVNEALVVAQDGSIKNVCVWLASPKQKGGAAAGPAVLDNHSCRFEPHIVTMQPGQTLELKNSDPVSHNTKGAPRNNPEFNLLIGPNQSQEVKNIAKAETKPFKVECNIHTWMKAYVIVTEGGFAAASGADGSFEIKGLPAGQELEFQVWQERGGYVKDASMGGKKTNAMGKVKLTLKPGDNDLGTIKAKIGGN